MRGISKHSLRADLEPAGDLHQTAASVAQFALEVLEGAGALRPSVPESADGYIASLFVWTWISRASRATVQHMLDWDLLKMG